MIYNSIYDFCKVRNIGTSLYNGISYTPRVQFILDLLDKEGIEYEVDTFTQNSERSLSWYFQEYEHNNFYNIILRGTSTKMVVAHHDICNHTIDNANDNSASIINAIALKKLRPDVHVVLLDGEEGPTFGAGSAHLSKQILDGDFGQIDWVLNFELTGKGGKYFFIGNYPGPLSDKIISLFNCPVVNTPFNDSATIRRYGIDSTVINPVPPVQEGETSNVIFADGTMLDTTILYNCHTHRDTIDSISVEDMKEFVEDVVLKIIDSE